MEFVISGIAWCAAFATIYLWEILYCVLGFGFIIYVFEFIAEQFKVKAAQFFILNPKVAITDQTNPPISWNAFPVLMEYPISKLEVIPVVSTC